MNLTPARRAYLYGIVLAALPILVVTGVLAGDQVQHWTNLAAAILGIPTAALALHNVNPDPGPGITHEQTVAQLAEATAPGRYLDRQG